MKGALIVLIVAVFLVLFCAFLVQDVEPGKGLGGRLYYLLLSGLLKADLALGKGMRYLKLPMETVFRSYHGTGKDLERIHRKEQRLREFRQEAGNSASRQKKERYNRKILNN